jgi:hypothetical protein
MALPFSWPVLVPYALRAPAPVNLGVRPSHKKHQTMLYKYFAAITIVAVAHGSTQAATLYHCKNYSGGTFWSSAPCSTHNALIDRLVSVPDNMPFAQQVEIGNRVRAEAQALVEQQVQVQQQPAQQQPDVNCAAISQEIASLDALARQPQSAGTQDNIAQRRKSLRDIQFRNRCR